MLHMNGVSRRSRTNSLVWSAAIAGTAAGGAVLAAGAPAAGFVGPL